MSSLDRAMWVIASFVLGTACGSFAALVADRVPRGESVWTGRSRCENCARSLGPRDLVPILSWCLLGGRCRTCRTRIGATSPVVEMVTGISFALAAVQFHDAASLIAVWVLCTGLSALAVIDVRTYRLPRVIIHSMGVFGLPLLVVSALVAEDRTRIVSALFGAIGATAVMGSLYRVSRGGLGDGDVRLSSLLGLYLGWLGPSAVLTGFTLAFVLGAIVGVVVMIVGHGGRRTAIPFGPFLAAGALIVLLFPTALTQPWTGI